jgi:hypothetical protein
VPVVDVGAELDLQAEAGQDLDAARQPGVRGRARGDDADPVTGSQRRRADHPAGRGLRRRAGDEGASTGDGGGSEHGTAGDRHPSQRVGPPAGGQGQRGNPSPAYRAVSPSAQSSGYQRELVHRLRLPYPLLPDPRLSCARELGLPTFTAGDMTLYERLTLIVCEDMVEHVFHPIPEPASHARQVLRWLTKRREGGRTARM